MPTRTRIPHFKSEKEEAEWCDAHPEFITARQMAESRGLPYQTYLKGLLHQALERERKAG